MAFSGCYGRRLRSKTHGAIIMKYSREERLAIGRKIYEGKMTTSTAAEMYSINFYTARDYLREYKASIKMSLPTMAKAETIELADTLRSAYKSMTKEQLIEELVKIKLAEIRAEKKAAKEAKKAARLAAKEAKEAAKAQKQ